MDKNKNNLDIYKSFSKPPEEALRTIGFGNLKGKSDINPQWRYEAMTEQFGACGDGWKYEIISTFTEPVPETKELMLFIHVNLYFKKDEKWSDPIPSFGGDFLIKKDKNGLHGNDEAHKMALTDALGKSMSMLGVAADVYRGFKITDTKYQQDEQAAEKNKVQNENKRKEASAEAEAKNKIHILKVMFEEAIKSGMSSEDISALIKFKFNVSTSKDMSLAQSIDISKNYQKYWQEYLDTQNAGD